MFYFGLWPHATFLFSWLSLLCLFNTFIQHLICLGTVLGTGGETNSPLSWILCSSGGTDKNKDISIYCIDYITPYHITPYCIISHHITSYHIHLFWCWVSPPPGEERRRGQREVSLAHCTFSGLEREFPPMDEILGWGISVPFNRSNTGGRKCGWVPRVILLP